MLIRKAKRMQAKLRLGLSGASDSGKTWSALEIAHGMGGKIGLIDTESGRGELYGTNCYSKHEPDLKFDYDVLRLDAPFSPARYIEAMKAFEKAGYDVLIIDGISPAWTGAGGVLSMVDKATNQFQSWKEASPAQNALVDALIQSKMHLIVTFRSKVKYVVEKNAQGKYAPRKMGLTPIQRGEFEYEFTIFMSMEKKGNAQVTKDTSQILGNEIFYPSPATGRKLIEWLNSGEEVEPATEVASFSLPEILERIKKITDLAALKEWYSLYHRLYEKDFPKEFAEITKAKDERKHELMRKAELESFEADALPVSKHSQALVIPRRVP